jgi:hypothetical protein
MILLLRLFLMKQLYFRLSEHGTPERGGAATPTKAII